MTTLGKDCIELQNIWKKKFNLKIYEDMGWGEGTFER